MFKSGFISIIGRPNAGKSTLLNALIKSKISIITPKAQTTRNQIRGILTDDEAQLIFIDTPGVHKPQHVLGQVMNSEAFSAIKGVDLIYFIVDVSVPFGKGDLFLIQNVKKSKIPKFLILNKIDLVSKETLFLFIDTYKELLKWDEIVMISAQTGENLSLLVELTKKYMTDGVMYYPKDQICDYPEQFIISEVIREKIILLTQEEIPHSVAVVIESMHVKKGRMSIQAMILVERESQKGIIIGKGGSMIKQIGTNARLELESLLGNTIFLELFVRVEKDWRNRSYKLKQLGYVPIQVEG